MLELDHIMIWTPGNGQEIEFLKKVGFTSIISGTHDGQGTSGNYIFFLNFYIELIYISDAEKAKNQLIKFDGNYDSRTNWKTNDSSPFGLAFKMETYAKDNPPFKCTEYKADWITGDGILVANDNDKNSPFHFIVPPKMEFPNYNTMEEMMLDEKPESFKQNHLHENKIEKLTSLKVISKEQQTQCPEITKNNICIESGEEHLLEIEFDFNSKGQEINLEPDLPIIIKY